MKAFLKTKAGVVLVGFSVLAVWMLLAAQPAQAHPLTDPSCSGLPTAANFFGADAAGGTAPLSPPGSAGGAVTGTATPRRGTSESGEGNRNYYYAKITVPTLTAGELAVSDGTAASATYSSEAILCGRQEGNVSSLPSYASAHITADNAAAAALRAQTTAAAADTTGSAAINAERSARSALITAANALANYSGTTLVGGIAHALRRAANATSDTTAATALNGAADQAITDSNTARVAGGQDAIAPATTPGDATDDNATTEAAALTAVAGNLRIAAHALDPNMVFNINTLISSGDEEYVVVMTAPEGGTPAVSVTFKGVMSTVATDPAGGSFTQNNQRLSHALRATDPGLLTVETTGNEVDTKGTLNDGTADISMDEPSGGNFEIVSPMDDDADYTVFVAGQTRGERGDYGLKLTFGVADDLVSGGGAYTDTTLGDATDGSEDGSVTLERGRADYFFFTTAAADAGNLFLTVETEKHMDVTTETNTTGTLYGQDGEIVTDTNSGTGNNFLLRTPIASVKDYIIEVTGSSSSTEGKYVLKTTSTPAPTRGNAPDEILPSATDSIITNAGEVDPHSITVTKAGTLQVKTTGMTDTVGILYGPDGRQIATDDNSGADMNFLITEYVEAGQYVVTVEGQDRSVTNAAYILVVNFVEGVDVAQTPGTGTPGTGTPGTGTPGTGTPGTGTPAPDPDPRGVLDEPASGSARSGIGLVRGWVCQDGGEGVEIAITDADGEEVANFIAPYGSDRGDVDIDEHCDRRTDGIGFAVQYNYNLLPAGTYTVEAFVDGDRIGLTPGGQTNTFRVVRIGGEFEIRLSSGRIPVQNFPRTGETTILEWDQPSQNFQIVDFE